MFMALICDINICTKFLKIIFSKKCKFTLSFKYNLIMAKLILDYLVLSSAKL